MKVCSYLALAILCCAFTSDGSAAEEQKGKQQLLRHSYKSVVDNLERDYFLYLPNGYEKDSSKKWPVLVYLHGDGERGNGKEDLDYVLGYGPLYEAWIQKKDLPFIGLPDPEHKILKLYGQEVKLFKLGRMPAQMLIDKSGMLRYVHYGHSMTDIPSNKEIMKLIKQ